MKNSPKRGFDVLIGKTIKKIDASCINVVHIECETGEIISLDTEAAGYGLTQIIVSKDDWEVK